VEEILIYFGEVVFEFVCGNLGCESFGSSCDGVGMGGSRCSYSSRSNHSPTPDSSWNTRPTQGTNHRGKNESTAVTGRCSACSVLTPGDILEVRAFAGVQRPKL